MLNCPCPQTKLIRRLDKDEEKKGQTLNHWSVDWWYILVRSQQQYPSHHQVSFHFLWVQSVQMLAVNLLVSLVWPKKFPTWLIFRYKLDKPFVWRQVASCLLTRSTATWYANSDGYARMLNTQVFDVWRYNAFCKLLSPTAKDGNHACNMLPTKRQPIAPKEADAS